MATVAGRERRGLHLALLISIAFAIPLRADEKTDQLRQPEWWLKRATEEAMKIEPGPRRKNLQLWIQNAQEEFGADQPVDESKADADYYVKKLERLIQKQKWEPAVRAGEKALELNRSDQNDPYKLYPNLVRALSHAGRLDEAYKLAERVPKSFRDEVVGNIVLMWLEKDRSSALAMVEQHPWVNEWYAVRLGFRVAMAAKSPELLEKTVKRGIEHLQQYESDYKRVRDVRRELVSDLSSHVFQHLQRGEELSADMKAAVIKSLERIVQVFPEATGMSAGAYALLGEVDTALKMARLDGEEDGRTSAGALVRGLVKKGRYEEALKFAPENLEIIVQGYAEEGHYEKALEVAKIIRWDDTDIIDVKGYRRNQAIFSVATIQANAGKIEQSLATLDHLAPTKDERSGMHGPERCQAEEQVEYATRLAYSLTPANFSGSRQLLAYAKNKLKQVPQAGRDRAVQSITGAFRSLEEQSAKQDFPLEDLQELADTTPGAGRIQLLTKIAALHWKKNDTSAYRNAMREAAKSAGSMALEPRERLGAWLSIAAAENLAKDQKDVPLKVQNALDNAWKAGEEALATGKEDSVMLRFLMYGAILRAYHQMGRWEELPEAFMKIESPYDRAAAFYSAGAMLGKEDSKRLFQ